MSSPRLRPVSTSTPSSTTTVTTVKPGPSSEESLTDTIPIANLKEESKDVKTDDKTKLSYAVGERCLARWRDNRRFIATILNDLGNGKLIFGHFLLIRLPIAIQKISNIVCFLNYHIGIC